MGHNGSKIFKKRLRLQITAQSFLIFLIFLPNGPHKTTFCIFEILSSDFLTIFVENFKLTIAPQGETKKSVIWKINDRRAKWTETWDKQTVL